eukprot:scaffold1973_cov72-Cylindrotheca_fusiformis.AAC.2
MAKSFLSEPWRCSDTTFGSDEDAWHWYEKQSVFLAIHRTTWLTNTASLDAQQFLYSSNAFRLSL